MHLVYSLSCSPSGEDGVLFHGYVFEKGCQLNKCGGDVGPDNRVSLFWYVWGDNWWNISTDVCQFSYYNNNNSFTDTVPLQV